MGLCAMAATAEECYVLSAAVRGGHSAPRRVSMSHNKSQVSCSQKPSMPGKAGEGLMVSR